MYLVCFGVDKGANRTENADYNFPFLVIVYIDSVFQATFRFIAKETEISIYIHL